LGTPISIDRLPIQNARYRVSAAGA
jgi:hypothetical protein